MIRLIIWLVVIISLGWLAMTLFRKRSEKKSAVSPMPADIPETPPPEQELTDMLHALLAVNLMIRKDATLSGHLLTQIEEIIDDLRSVVPEMMTRYPGETLTYEIKKIGLSHLRRIVKEFLDLSEESRKIQEPVFKESIGALQGVTRRARQIVEKNETAEFKTMAHFLAGKFSNEEAL